MDSLVTRIEAAADHGNLTVVSGDDHLTLPWAQVHDEARAMAAALQARGVVPGDHIALLGPTTRNLITAIEAVWLAGACVMVLPLPMRMSSLEVFVAQTRGRIRNGDARLVLVDPDLAPYVVAEPGDPPFVLLSDLVAAAGPLGPEAWDRPADDPERLAILQFTSGSTSDPKGVMLPHRVMCANLDGIAQVTDYDIDSDVLVSWLPLYHDMGLVGLFGLSITNGGSLVQGAPQDFMARPARWMEWISTYQGTATAGPNFAWVLATRTLRRAETLDLSRLRVALNGAEPVDAAAVRAFIEAAERHGMRPGAVFPAFGMAEVAIAGTFPEPLAGLRTDVVDKRVLETERYAAPVESGADGAKELALLGRPIPGLELRIVDRDGGGSVLAEREVGELEIRGTSVTTGYYRNPEATAAAFDGDWLRTGDLAYLVGDELVICGRIKDVIILAGRNIFPEDVERAVGDVDGVRTGNVIVFGVEGRRGLESMAVVAEVRSDDHATVIDAIHRQVRAVAGTPPHDVVLVAPGSLPKTSSGKLQRSLCKERFLAGELEPASLGAS